MSLTFPGTLTVGYTRTSAGGLDPYGGTGVWNNHPANFETSDWLGGGWDGANGQSVSPAPVDYPTVAGFSVTVPSDRPISEITNAATLTPGTWVSGNNFVTVWITSTHDGPSNYVFAKGVTLGPIPSGAPSASRIGPRQYQFSIPSATAGDGGNPGTPFTYELVADGVAYSATAGTPITHTFASGGWKSVYYKVTNGNGLWTVYALYLRVNIAPVAAFTWSETGTGEYPVSVDGTASSDADNQPVTPLNYLWDFGDGTGTYTGATRQHNYDTDGEFDVTLTVNDGEDSDSVTHTVTVSGLCIGLDTNAPGDAYGAVTVGTNIQTVRLKTTVADQEVMGTITGAKNPSLWVQSANIYVAATKTDGSYHLWRSVDFARTWGQITMATIWDGSNYNRAGGCGLIGGGAASVANKTSTTPLQVWFKATTDLTTWPSDGAAVQVGTYSGSFKQFSVRQRAEAGRLDLIVTNNVDKAWLSTDNGRTWTDL